MWSINRLAKLAGTTSRTLRHYGDVGLLPPSRVGSNGYRYYDEAALVRLQRILLLRELGLGLPAIAEVLDRQQPQAALRDHLRWLESEQDRLTRQVVAVRSTITKLDGGEPLMADESLDGFDHTRYREEVERRWGQEAYAHSDRWWRSLTDADKQGFLHEQQAIAQGFGAAKQAGQPADSDEVQALTQRQFEWLRGIPGTPGSGAEGPSREYFTGLGEMYVADPRFRANFDIHAEGTAELIRDAMQVYADRHL